MVWNPVTHITDQFKKPTINDFPDTYKPLPESHRLSSNTDGEGLAGYDEKKGIPGNASSTGSFNDDQKSVRSDLERGRGGPMSREKLREALDAEATSNGLSSMYDRTLLSTPPYVTGTQSLHPVIIDADRQIEKSKIINMAITDIGMGRYQWGLFVLCGFGKAESDHLSTLCLLIFV